MDALQSINTCVIPAAGKGSRWAPVSGYLPKEMLPLIDRPVIDWVIKEAILSGCTKIIVVLNENKEIIKDYLEKEQSRYKNTEFIFVYQKEALGLTNALFLCTPYIDSDFALALPDLPTISSKPVLKQLMDTFDKNQKEHSVISFDEFPTETLHHYSECQLTVYEDSQFRIAHFCPKGQENISHHSGNKLRMSGRYILKKDLFSIINQIEKERDKGELNEVVILKKALNQKHKFIGYSIKGHTYDTGTPITYVRANTAFYKKSLLK